MAFLLHRFFPGATAYRIDGFATLTFLKRARHFSLSFRKSSPQPGPSSPHRSETSGIEYTCNDHIHINVYFGQYYYSGRFASSTETFFAVSGVWYFTAAHQRSLISPPAKKAGSTNNAEIR